MVENSHHGPSARYSARTASLNTSQDQHSYEVVSSHEPERVVSWYDPSTKDIFFFGIAMIICGQTISWNIGLNAGVLTFLIAYVIMGFAYIAFCCCMAELTSALPFAGGSYGLARCTLGFFPAFLIGCIESLEYMTAVAAQAICVSTIISIAAPSLVAYTPLVSIVVFFIPTIVIQCLGGGAFWITSIGIALYQLMLMLIYCFGLLGQVNFSQNALKDSSMLFVGGIDMAMCVFPFSAWFFMGLESLNLASNEVGKPKTQVPYGQVASVCVIFVTGLCVILTVVSIPVEGGIAATANAAGPMDSGLVMLFGIKPEYGLLFVLPAQLAGGYGASWASSKLISSMGRSRLLPPWLGITSQRYGTAHWAILTTSVIAYAICLIVFYQPSVTEYIVPTSLLFAFISYSGQCIGYILLTVRYPITSLREFKNPFGLVGAVYALLVWLIAIVAIVGFQGHHGIELLGFTVVAIVLAVYYQLVAKKRQTISKEESKVLLVAHIAFFNKRKKQKQNKSSQQTKRTSALTSTGQLLRSNQNLAKVAVENITRLEQSNPLPM